MDLWLLQRWRTQWNAKRNAICSICESLSLWTHLAPRDDLGIPLFERQFEWMDGEYGNSEFEKCGRVMVEPQGVVLEREITFGQTHTTNHFSPQGGRITRWT